MSYVLSGILSIFATPLGTFAFAFCLLFCDYFILFPRHWILRAIFGPAGDAPRTPLPSGLLIIPTLLRVRDEVEALKATIENVMVNDYPGRMVIIASIDGYDEAPSLYQELVEWIATKQSALAPNVWLYITGRHVRGGKPMAIEEGVVKMHELVASGEHPRFPEIYFSTDADADLGPRALEHIARRLCRKNWFTGSPGRAVAGNLYVRGDAFWKGWRHFFTQEGQLSIQVAREYLVTNIARYNKRPFPLSGTTGVLYCIWTDIFLEGPRFMGFMRTLRFSDWLKWWVGHAPPKFSESQVKPIPELMAGDTDDTVSAFLAIIARWENGRFTLDAPRTPLHALYYALRGFFVDRALRYEPEARVYTSSPATVKALWKQRVRWNASRIEVAGRFSNSYWYHWDLGVSAIGVVALMLKYVFFGLYYYVQLPLAALRGSLPLRIAEGLTLQIAMYALWTTLALMMNGEFRKNWRLLLALPMSPLFTTVYGFWATMTGVVADVFLFGNVTKFAPESTLIKGRSYRVALMARARRLLVLLLRSAIYGDVPLGLFWIGWNETAWTPSGFAGWSTGKRPSLWQRLRHGAATVSSAPIAAMASTPAEGEPAQALSVAPTSGPRMSVGKLTLLPQTEAPANEVFEVSEGTNGRREVA